MQVGDVVKVRDWPDVQGSRFLVIDLVTNERSEWKEQVYTRFIEHYPSAEWPNGRTSFFRAFPADRCEVDRAASSRWR